MGNTTFNVNQATTQGYFERAINHGDGLIETWLDATKDAVESFFNTHKNDKNWKADFYASLIGHGVEFLLRPLVGPVAKLPAGILKQAGNEAIKGLQASIARDLETQLLIDTRRRKSATIGQQKTPAAETMYNKMQAGIREARDIYKNKMNNFLQPLLPECAKLAREQQANLQVMINHQDRLEALVAAILPCGQVKSQQVYASVLQGLETLWRLYVRDQQTILQKLEKDFIGLGLITPESFIPVGGWRYRLKFKPAGQVIRVRKQGLSERAGMSAGKLARRDRVLGLIPAGNYRVDFTYTVLFQWPGTSISFDVPKQWTGYCATDQSRDLINAYETEWKKGIGAMWSELMPRRRWTSGYQKIQ